jgi:hypothetical protein
MRRRRAMTMVAALFMDAAIRPRPAGVKANHVIPDAQLRIVDGPKDQTSDEQSHVGE